MCGYARALANAHGSKFGSKFFACRDMPTRPTLIIFVSVSILQRFLFLPLARARARVRAPRSASYLSLSPPPTLAVARARPFTLARNAGQYLTGVFNMI